MNQAEPEDGGHAADSAGHEVTFDEIVAEWVAEGTVPQWPDSAPPTPSVGASPVPPDGEPEVVAAEPVEVVDPLDVEEHFVPPDPPPMPRLGVTASIGLALLALGVMLLAMPAILGGGADLGLPLGLVCLALGLGWLVLRCWPARDGEDDGDDGAVL